MNVESKKRIVREILSAKLVDYERNFGPVSKEDFNLDRFIEGLPYTGSVDIVKEIESFNFLGFFTAGDRMINRKIDINFDKEFEKLDKTKKTAVILWFDSEYKCFTLNEVLFEDVECLVKESNPFDFDIDSMEIDDEFARDIGKSVLERLAIRNKELSTVFHKK